MLLQGTGGSEDGGEGGPSAASLLGGVAVYVLVAACCCGCCGGAPVPLLTECTGSFAHQSPLPRPTALTWLELTCRFVQERARSIVTAAAHGGEACPPLAEKKACAEAPCRELVAPHRRASYYALDLPRSSAIFFLHSSVTCCTCLRRGSHRLHRQRMGRLGGIRWRRQHAQVRRE